MLPPQFPRMSFYCFLINRDGVPSFHFYHALLSSSSSSHQPPLPELRRPIRPSPAAPSRPLHQPDCDQTSRHPSAFQSNSQVMLLRQLRSTLECPSSSSSLMFSQVHPTLLRKRSSIHKLGKTETVLSLVLISYPTPIFPSSESMHHRLLVRRCILGLAIILHFHNCSRSKIIGINCETCLSHT
jgi:hypothetical protein